MSKQKLFHTKGYLLTNASRLRGAPTRSNPPIEPKDEPHTNGCGCLSCRVTHRVDEAVDQQLGKLSTSARARDGLAPTPGVLSKRRPKGKSKGTGKGKPGAPLMPPRGVLAGDAS